jgi:type IV secretory pathway TraG/TraD family ATPase VirD4
MGQQEVKLASLLPALVKLIFQRTVISRFDRYASWELHNCERPVLFMADEYHMVATQQEGRFGDAQFFSLGRQMGALSFIATQSVQQLLNSPIKEAWKAVFDVLSAVMVMSGNDPETAEYVDRLAAANEAVTRTVGRNLADGKDSTSVSPNLGDRRVIPPGVLQMLKQGQAIVIGKTGGQTERAGVRYLQVPAH